MAVVAAVTGYHGNPAYARQLLQQEDQLDAGNEGADVKETTVTELDEETRKKLEEQIEDLIVPDTMEEHADDEGVKERQGDGGDDEMTLTGDEKNAATDAEGRIAITLSFT